MTVILCCHINVPKFTITKGSEVQQISLSDPYLMSLKRSWMFSIRWHYFFY